MSVLLILSVLFWLGGCAGDGQGLDENGNPVGNDGGIPIAFAPTFTNIQQNVFNAICVECHAGASAPEGLRLDPENSYETLIDARSSEVPGLLRVAPGNPDASYIIHKLEGGPDIVGSQMPFNRAPLSQQTINSIRVWIAQGAPKN